MIYDMVVDYCKHRQIDRQMDRLTDGQTDRQIDRQTDGQTDGLLCLLKYVVVFIYSQTFLFWGVCACVCVYAHLHAC